MRKSVQKITLSPSRDIPFNRLVLSQSNVRRIKAGVSVEQLAESIAQRTLLQGFSVRAVVDAEGNETGMFEVPAGGRRYRALELMVKQKRMSKTQAVPCIVREGGIAEDDSIAENDERAGLHPLDQFRAFMTLRGLGMSEEDIAARHFVPLAIVSQRLRLASVSPKLHEAYAGDAMTLEQLMAFSVNGDHARQEQVWDEISRSGYDGLYQIRRQLTEDTVRASDRRARFVGLAAYEETGGPVLRDLFEDDHGGWLQDVGLLDRLVAEKLKAGADAIALEGWKWISVAVDFPFGHANALRKLEGTPVPLTADQQAAFDTLNAEHARLEAEYRDADELPVAIDQRLGEIEGLLLALEDRTLVYDPADIARAGVFVSLDSEGRLSPERGFVRPDDEGCMAGPDAAGGGRLPGVGEASVPPGTAITVAGMPSEPTQNEEEDNASRSLPDRLISEMTTHRTLALRDALAQHPSVAFLAVLHNFALATFYRFASSAGCLEIAVRTPAFSAQPPGLKESASAIAIEQRLSWKARLPNEESDLWERLVALDSDARSELFAHCASFAVNAVHEKASARHQGRVSAYGVTARLDQADVLARAVGLDMVRAGWRPKIDNYLGRVTRSHILEAVREARGEASAKQIDHLKKQDMAREAERLLDGTGWLPEPLRLAGAAVPAPAQNGDARASSEDSPEDEGDSPEEEIRGPGGRLDRRLACGPRVPACHLATSAEVRHRRRASASFVRGVRHRPPALRHESEGRPERFESSGRERAPVGSSFPLSSQAFAMPNLPVVPAAGAPSVIGQPGDVCFLAPRSNRNSAARGCERESV